MDGVNPAQFDSGYHHHKTQWFHNGKVAGGMAGTGLMYGSEPRDKFNSAVFPLEPHKVNPSSMQDTHRPLSKHYHLQNAHSQGFELGLTSTNDPRALNDRFTRKQHFVRGKIPGGSASNKMIYGTDELLHQAGLKENYNPSGFLYGTEAATKVGKPAPAPRPNNMIWLEERTEKEAVKNKKLAQHKMNF